MADPLHPTNDGWFLNDPVEFPPPRGGESLLLINPGGVLIIGPWADGCLAWGRKPKIPDSVKVREASRTPRPLADIVAEARETSRALAVIAAERGAA